MAGPWEMRGWLAACRAASWLVAGGRADYGWVGVMCHLARYLGTSLRIMATVRPISLPARRRAATAAPRRNSTAPLCQHTYDFLCQPAQIDRFFS